MPREDEPRVCKQVFPTCDLCGVVIDGDNHGQTTESTILCVACLETLVRKEVREKGVGGGE